MSTEFFNDQWRIPSNENQNKVSNYSMQFLRADATQLNVPITSDFAFGSGGFTISFWINFTIKHFSSTLLDFRSLSVLDNQPSLSFGLTNGVEWRRQGASPAKLPINIPASEFTVGNWNNIVISNDGSTTKFYLDGVEKGSTADSVNYNQSCPLTVGQSIDGGNFWTSAKFDEIGIFNTALPATGTNSVATLYGNGTALTNPMALSPAPVAYYQLGDQSVSTGATSDYLVPNNSLQDYVFNFTQGSTSTTRTRISIPSYILTQAATVSLWVKFDLASPISVLLGGASGERYPLVKKFPNNFQVWITTSGAPFDIFSTNVLFSPNTWFHIAITQNSSSATLYINGEVPSSGGTANPITLTLNTIGNNSSGGEGLVGQMSNVSIFNTELPATGTESITSLYNNGSPPADISSYSGLQRWYKLNAQDTFDGSNWTIKDYASSNDGTSVNMTSANLVQSDLQHTSGYSPYAITLDGTGEVFNLDSEILLPDNKSVSFWFKLRVVPAGQFAIPLSSSNNRYYPLLQNNGGNFRIFLQGANGAIPTNTSVPIVSGVWYNLIITGDGTTPIIYINGASVSNFGSGVDRTDVLIGDIGARPGGSFDLDGDMSNVAVWSGTTLSSTEVTEVYNQGVPSNLNTFSGTKPTAWWQLGSNSSFNSATSQWTCLDEIGTNNAASLTNMANDDITNGVGYSANGLGTSSIDIVGDAPYSSGNGLSENQDVLARVKDTPPT